LIKINEDKVEGNGKKELSISHQGKVHVTLDNDEEKTFDHYPIVIKSKVIEHLTLKIQKATKIKPHDEEKGGIVDKVLEKAKDVKDKMIDTTKEITDKTKDTASQQQQESKSTLSEDKIENQQSTTNNEKERFDDPLINRK
jgi:hypothetical protein